MLIYGNFTSFLCCLVCVLLHEMGHAYVGRKLGYKLNMITLLPYGAMLSGKNTPFDTNDDIKIAIAGPLVNVVLIILCFVFWWIFPSTYNVVSQFMTANIYTFCFNVLPIFPLDGGRILMALLSKKMPRTKAQKICKIVGYILTAIVFILFFISFFFSLNYMLGINALFLLIGLFEEDSSAYYEKLTTFEQKPKNHLFFKTIKLSKDEPIFVAYKKIINNNVSTIKIMNKKEVVSVIPRKEVLDGVLKLPINTKLEELAKTKK